MSSLYIWLAAASLLIATWTAALIVALLRRSHSAIAAELERRGRLRDERWLAGHGDDLIISASLVRTTARLAFFALVLAQIVGLRSEAALTWADVAIAAAISVPLVWLFTSVLAGAIARYVGAGLISASLPIMRPITFLLWPLTRAVSLIDEAVRRLTGANLRVEDESEAELLRSIEETHREGGLDRDAAHMLENIVEFTNTDVAEIMTPRTDIHGIELTNDLAQIRRFIIDAGHSRIPVYRGNLDHVAGVLYVRDLVPYLGEDANGFELEPLLRQPIFVPETKPVRELLTDFQRSEVHMAIVIDEYGGTEGLVTIEDVLEEIVGEIRDEHDVGAAEEEPTLRFLDDRIAEVDARYHIDDLNDRLGLGLPEDDDFDTIGGFVLAQLGHVPAQGESFEGFNARFTAVETAATHVQKIHVELLAGANGE